MKKNKDKTNKKYEIKILHRTMYKLIVAFFLIGCMPGQYHSSSYQSGSLQSTEDIDISFSTQFAAQEGSLLYRAIEFHNLTENNLRKNYPQLNLFETLRNALMANNFLSSNNAKFILLADDEGCDFEGFADKELRCIMKFELIRHSDRTSLYSKTIERRIPTVGYDHRVLPYAFKRIFQALLQDLKFLEYKSHE